MARWLVALGIVLTLAWCVWGDRAIARPDGVLAPNEPLQESVDDGPQWELSGYRVRALASFELDARVLSAERYRRGREAELSPVDLAVGWGPMSDTAVIDTLSIWQGARFYQYSWDSSTLQIRPGDIARHSANMHMIPADEVVRASLLEARAGHLVHLKGWLVEATGTGGWRWKSSLVRGDTGGGACELVLVESLSLE